MTDSREPRKDPNATIQIDLAQVQLYDPRAVPPPLPGPPPLPVFAGPAQPNPLKIVAYVALLVVLVGGAVVGGLFVGTRARGRTATPRASSTMAVTAVTPSARAGAPSAAASQGTLNLPTIEMR